MGVSNAQAYGIVGAVKGTGGTPDLSLATGGGKTSIQKALNSVIQVDPTKITGLYREGAQTLEQYYKQGLEYYSNSIDQAAKEINNAYSESNITLAPLSQAGQVALNEQLRMLGLSGISPTLNYYNKLSNLAQQDEEIKDFQTQLQAAEKITDPTARAQTKAEIINKLGTLQESIDTKAQKAIDDLGPVQKTTDVNAEVQRRIADATANNRPWNEQKIRDRVEEEANQQQKNVDRYNQQVKDIKAQAENAGNLLQQFEADYNQNYSTDSMTPYTGDQAIAKLESTPGYLSALQSGTNALTRQGAALGRLMSGTTAAALIDYGQGVADTTFNNYMTNLGNIAAMGSQATNAIANNQVSQGQSLSQLETLRGGAGAETYQGIGTAYNQAYANEAQARQQIAMFNAQMQYNSKQANLNRQANAAIAGQQSAAGIMNAATNAAQFNYGVYQNQQMANSFAANSMTPLQQYTGYWGTPQSSGGYSTGWSL